MQDVSDLLLRAQAGDPAAFERLVRTEAGRLHSLAWRTTGDPHLAEDVVQEVFAAILENRAPYRGEGAAGAWLRCATLRRAIDRRRWRASSRRRESVYAVSRKEAVSQEDPIGADERALLASALAVLPAETRACLWLHFSEGLTVREVAECVGKRHSTVGERIQRGLDLLRKELRRRGLAVASLDPLPEAFEALARGSPPQSLVENLLQARGAPPGNSRLKV